MPFAYRIEPAENIVVLRWFWDHYILLYFFFSILKVGQKRWSQPSSPKVLKNNKIIRFLWLRNNFFMTMIFFPCSFHRVWQRTLARIWWCGAHCIENEFWSAFRRLSGWNYFICMSSIARPPFRDMWDYCRLLFFPVTVRSWMITSPKKKRVWLFGRVWYFLHEKL